MHRKLFIVVLAAAAAMVVAAAALPTQAPARATAPPRNTSPPTIDDTTPVQGQTLRADPGTWTGTQPFVITYRWRRCNSTGGACVDIPGGNANDQTYEVRRSDIGFTLRVRVTVRNAEGEQSARSAATSVVTAAPPAPPPPAGNRVSITAVTLPDRLVIDQVQFSPNPIRSRDTTLTVRVHVVDTRGRIVQGALVFARSTPLVTTSPPEQATDADGWATLTSRTERDFSIVFRPGYNLQWFVRARKPGENALAGVSTRRLVQVAISPSR